MPPPPERVRVDRWLLAARLCKTRSDAQDACSGGKVEVNGARVTAHRLVRAGDRISVRTPVGRRELEIEALAERRLSPPEARLLYRDLTPKPPEEAAAPPPAHRERGSGRPSKRDRRRIDRFRGA